MDYYINPSVFTAVFTVPTVVVDRYLKFAKSEHIKVLLYIMRNMTLPIDPIKIAEQTGVSEYDVKEALLYWADAEIILPKEVKAVPKKAEEQPKTVRHTVKPAREDVARRGAEDEKIRYLLRETQLKLGRNLKSNEASTLVWLYDDEGLDISLILLIVQYAVAHNKANIRFIESIAVDWINKGISSINEADEQLRLLVMGEQAWNVVCMAFGLEKRKPSQKETELSLKWINEWKLSKDMLVAAYEECVDKKSKFSMAYTAKILENWHQNGYKAPADTEAKKPKQKNSFGAYDLDLFEKSLDMKG